VLYFFVPLRSRAVSRDWNKVAALCRRTLLSCSAQTLDRFRIVLACHEVPDIPREVRNLTVIQMDGRIPANSDDQMTDKYRKIQRALLSLRGQEPFYWMKVDADDCVSNRLCEFVTSAPAQHGWYLPSGYVYTEGQSHLYFERRNFHRWCGTSTILRAASADGFPTPSDNDVPDFEFLKPHHELVEHMEAVGTPLAALPFPGGVYCVGSGENWSGFGGVTELRSKSWTIRRWINRRKLTAARAQEFSLSSPPLIAS
jgi:hypothetical protein